MYVYNLYMFVCVCLFSYYVRMQCIIKQIFIYLQFVENSVDDVSKE